VGLFVASRQRHPTRRLCLIPIGTGILTLGLALWYAGGTGGTVTALTGVSSGPLMAPRRIRRADGWTTDRVIASWEWRRVFITLALAILTYGVVILRWQGTVGGDAPVVVLLALAAMTFALTLALYRRQCFEQVIESSIWPFYRVRAIGPGMEQFPMTGPLLVIANHASYLDPIWMLKVLPRELTPMMYRRYFEWPVVHWFMAHVIRVIPVDAAYRHEVPELNEAVARLDRGEALLLFPEGWVRRTEDVAVRRFGQGVWRILRERPATPVVACWIEGGWGSLTSFQDGPPFRNKRLDLRRPIDIAVAAPVVFDAETLADQRQTRERLRALCADARRYLELPAVEE
jgi:1-acyl-sn-glycerol-3-phosphate acyltransferase